MSRILEFQPSDEQTVISRVLVELHQAIDANFPNTNQSTKQFSKTVLTHQSDSTHIDNKPSSKSEPQFAQKQVSSDKARQISEAVSMTPKTGHRSAHAKPMLHTAEMRAMLGESSVSRGLKIFLILLLLIGVLVLGWLVFFRPETINDIN